MKNTFQGKVVVVTGATSGIGRAAAAEFAKRGARVISVARRPSEQFESVCADVTDEAQVEAAVGEIIRRCGRIDILVNNAGGGISGAIEDTPPAEAERLMQLNFFGAFRFVRAVLPHMRAQGSGTIVNVSSVAAEFAIPFQAFYSASKAALSSLSDALRIEVAPFGIGVGAVLPGDVRTQFTASRKKETDSAAYAARAARAVGAMERDERGGMSPEQVARAIVRAAGKKHPPVCKVVGGKYRLFVLLKRILPARLVNALLGKMYG